MTEQIMEFAAYKLATGKSEAELLAASDLLERDFLAPQKGFLRRDLIRKDDGSYVDVIVWQSRADFAAAFELAKTSTAAAHYFAHMHVDPDAPHGGVEHAAMLRPIS